MEGDGLVGLTLGSDVLVVYGESPAPDPLSPTKIRGKECHNVTINRDMHQITNEKKQKC